MRFLLAALYRDKLRWLTEAAAGQARPPEQLVTVACPRCRLGYFAAYVGEPITGLIARRRARRLLDQECPDHPRAFPAD